MKTVRTEPRRGGTDAPCSIGVGYRSDGDPPPGMVRGGDGSFVRASSSVVGRAGSPGDAGCQGLNADPKVNKLARDDELVPTDDRHDRAHAMVDALTEMRLPAVRVRMRDSEPRLYHRSAMVTRTRRLRSGGTVVERVSFETQIEDVAAREAWLRRELDLDLGFVSLDAASRVRMTGAAS
ncbi:MAG: hypothetical protein AAGF47_08045 [Planctomycetota bacterium]